MRARLLRLAGLGALVASSALAGCGDSGDSGELASMVPPDVPLYAETVLRPQGDQRDAIEALASRVGGIDDPGGELIAAVDAELAQQPGGMTYAGDIEPWLGERGAGFVRSFEGDGTDPDGAALVETTDPDAAQDFLDRAAEADPEFPGESRSYEGADYRVDDEGGTVGLVDDVLVIGTEEAFKVVVDASDGESLAESEDYLDRTAPLEGGALGLLYLEPVAAIQAAASSGELSSAEAAAGRALLAGRLSEPVTFGISASEETATLDAVVSIDGAEPAAGDGALQALPAGAWLAAELRDVGGLLERWLDSLAHSGVPEAARIERRIAEKTGLDPRRDLTSWLGDVGFFVRGTSGSDFAAGAIAETSDVEGPRNLVSAVRALAEGNAPLPAGGPPDGADYGFTFGVPGLGPGAEAGVFDDQLVAAFATSIDEVLEPEETLAEDDAFNAAIAVLRDDFAPTLYLDLRQAYELVIAGADTKLERGEYEAARPYVEQLGSLIAGMRVDDDLLASRLVVTVAQ